MHVDTLWSNVHLITLDGEGLGVIRDGVLACADGRIVHVGAAGSDATCSRPPASMAKAAGSRPA